jgi:hypothetical protein
LRTLPTRNRANANRALAKSALLIVILLVLLFDARASSADTQDRGFVRTVTQAAYSLLPACNTNDCVILSDGGTAYTSDYALSQIVSITLPKTRRSSLGKQSDQTINPSASTR